MTAHQNTDIKLENFDDLFVGHPSEIEKNFRNSNYHYYMLKIYVYKIGGDYIFF